MIVDPDVHGVVSSASIRAAIRPDNDAGQYPARKQRTRDDSAAAKYCGSGGAERQRRFEAGEQTPIWLHTDASQGAGQIDISPARLGVDAMTLNAGKIYGPKQVGLLGSIGVFSWPLSLSVAVKSAAAPGTENVAGTVGFA